MKLTENQEIDLLVCDSPGAEPLEMRPLRTRALHTKANSPEQPEETNDKYIQRAEDDPIDLLVQLPRCPVNTESRSKNSEVERGVVVVDISNTTHSNERQVVEEPTDDGVETRVFDVFDFDGLEIVVTALPADQVPKDYKSEDAERSGATPIDGWVTEEEVFDD